MKKTPITTSREFCYRTRTMILRLCQGMLAKNPDRLDSTVFSLDALTTKTEKRGKLRSLEVILRGSKSHSSSMQIFAGAFPQNYEPPSGFYFELNGDSPPVQDDVLLFDYNVQERVNAFVSTAFHKPILLAQII